MTLPVSDVRASSVQGTIHPHDDEESAIMSIRATDVSLGLGRLPAGFHAIVQHTGLEWRTENKPVSVDNDVVEWSGLIPIPFDLSATVSLGIYASFEFQPVLGKGEQLQMLTITVKQLLDRAENHMATFEFLNNDDGVSPCSSLSIAIKRRKQGSGDSLATTHCSTAESQHQIERATNEGRIAHSQYRKHGGKQDLERSIEHFERALNICPLDDPCRAAALSNLAMVKFAHSQLGGDDDVSFRVPLTLYRDALAARPVSHPDRPSTLMKLAEVHLARFAKRQDKVDATEADAFLHEAIELSSRDSHEYRAASSMLQQHVESTTAAVMLSGESSVENSASSSTDVDRSLQLIDRYTRFGDLTDLQQAISILEASIRSISPKDDRYSGGLVNLGIALRHRFNRLGELNDLEVAISKQRDALNFILDSHPYKPMYISTLANSLITRFERLGDLNSLEEAISKQRNTVDLTRDGDPRKPGRLNDLGNSFLARFRRLGQLNDLEEAIARHRNAVDLAHDTFPEKPMFLDNLAISFRTKFGCLEKSSDLEEAISRVQDAVHITPHGHPDRSARLASLGNYLSIRFQCLGELSDLEEAILKQREAVDITPHGHPDKPWYLNDLGTSLVTRFQHLGGSSDLEEAISRQQDAISLIPDGHSNMPTSLINFAMTLFIRFQHLGKLVDLREAISRQQNAIDLTPNCHSEKPGRLNFLSKCFITRYERLGNPSDLDEAISRLQSAVDFLPDAHPDKLARLHTLGSYFFTRFRRVGGLNDLQEAISMFQGAVNSAHAGHSDKPVYLINLGASFYTRFHHRGELSDLEAAISLQQDAVDCIPDNHPEKPLCLNNLGISLKTRFERLGQLSDLEGAILKQQEAADLIPHGDSEKPWHLNNLGTSYLERFDYLGELSDLEEAVSRHRDSVCQISYGHPHRLGCLNNLGMALNTRFQRLGELNDLEESISRLREATELTPGDHPDKPRRLNNLANSVFSRFKCLGELDDLEDAISIYQDAVGLIPDGHPQKAGRLYNLSNCFLVRFRCLKDARDIAEAISRQQDAISLTPDGHPDKPSYLNNLGDCFLSRFEHLKNRHDLEQAIIQYSNATCSPVGSISVRFHASRKWISCARSLRHRSLLRAYYVAIGLIPQLAWIGLSLAHRYHELVQAAGIVREAAATALTTGAYDIAVEWLEQGRSIVWGELLQLRSSYDELFSSYPDQARRLRELSAALEHASAAREKFSLPSSKQVSSLNVDYHQTASLQVEADRHRRLAIERDQLLRDIRALPGFERFLLHKKFSQLRAAAHSGPVVILNATELRCDALIISADIEHAIHVPLPNITLDRCKDFQTSMKNSVRDARDDRYGRPIPQVDSNRWQPILASLWKCVVKPVLDTLAFSTLGNLSRIYWCPTGPFTFLPIHAAGFYGPRSSAPGNKVFDFVVSSYIPTLSILASSSGSETPSPADIRLLAVRQPPSDGQSRLPGVATELERIKAIIETNASGQTVLTESSIGTVEEVLALMKEADWVHFACHGVQDDANPTASGLCLADRRRLRVSDIIALSRPRGGLAFLSACQTAKGDEDLSDEAIHIAAGMLFAGYGGVVGTMWSISDRIAPDVAKDVYEQLCRDSTPDYRGASHALHDAVGRLRDRNVSFEDWLPFIHVGL